MVPEKLKLGGIAILSFHAADWRILPARVATRSPGQMRKRHDRKKDALADACHHHDHPAVRGTAEGETIEAVLNKHSY
jgi:hypothetical protein